jgi:hypothetical protein
LGEGGWIDHTYLASLDRESKSRARFMQVRLEDFAFMVSSSASLAVSSSFDLRFSDRFFRFGTGPL